MSVTYWIVSWEQSIFYEWLPDCQWARLVGSSWPWRCWIAGRTGLDLWRTVERVAWCRWHSRARHRCERWPSWPICSGSRHCRRDPWWWSLGGRSGVASPDCWRAGKSAIDWQRTPGLGPVTRSVWFVDPQCGNERGRSCVLLEHKNGSTTHSFI